MLMLQLDLVKRNRHSTTTVSTSFTTKACLVAASILMMVATPVAITQTVKADKYDEQIAALQREIDSYNAEAAKLAGKRHTLENQLAQLNAEKAKIQKKIDLFTAKAKKLAAQIKQSEEEIAKNKDALGTIMADIAVDNDISPIEMLASSNNISDYIDKQTYRASVQQELNSTIKRINALKKKLEKQKKDVERALDDQKNARDQLAAKENEKARLISQTQGRESAFQKLSAKAKAEKDRVQEAQQRAIAAALAAAGVGGSAVAGDPGHGGYPNNLANADYYNPIVDPWGMYARQCVSYTAWKVYQKNGYMPYWGGHGNANQWPGNARAAGIRTSSAPRAKSVGVISAGLYGHVVWVESVNSNGTINISQYNEWLPGLGWGYYSERYNVNPGTYDTYIYF